MKDNIIGTLIGLAVGDAVGTTVEFSIRGTFPPVTDMVGGGPFDLEAGQWTDDTSMALCLADSIINSDFDLNDQMDRYVAWWQEGYLSSNGTCFDIGFTTRLALASYREDGNPYAGDEGTMSAGNGALMRIAPVIMAYHGRADFNHLAIESTRTTHPTLMCLDASVYFCNAVKRAYTSRDKNIIVLDDAMPYSSNIINSIASGSFVKKKYEDLDNTGYVMHSLESAMWCFYHTDTFKDAILKAVNLGGDSDTIAAICGQIAGAYYGLSGIPSEWVEKLAHKDLILGMANKIFDKYGA